MNKYEVTQDHIDAGKKDDCYFCPVALAFKEHVGGRISVQRGNLSSSIPLSEYARDYGLSLYSFSEPLRAWVMRFDECRPVKPMTVCVVGTSACLEEELK